VFTSTVRSVQNRSSTPGCENASPRGDEPEVAEVVVEAPVSKTKKRDRREYRTREARGLGEKNKTENLSRPPVAVREELRYWLPIYDEYAHTRPQTRGDCTGVERPCPWVSCRHNTYLHVKERSIVYNFPDLEPGDVLPDRSCALDIADRGEASLEEIALLTNITRERVRQIQEKALRRLKIRRDRDIMEYVEEHDLLTSPVPTFTRGIGISNRPKVTEMKREEVEVEPEVEEEEGFDVVTSSIGFLSEHPRARQVVTARMWNAYLRHSTESGHSSRKPTKREMFDEPVLDVESDIERE